VRAATLPLPHSITTWLFLPFANGSPSEHGQFFVLLFVTAALPVMIHNTRTATRHQNKYLRDLCVSTSACCVYLAVALRAKLTSLPIMAYWQPQSLKSHEPHIQLSFGPTKWMVIFDEPLTMLSNQVSCLTSAAIRSPGPGKAAISPDHSLL
jgi:hypothetical protein